MRPGRGVAGLPGTGPRLTAKRALDCHSTEQWWHCPQYAANGQGIHVQCRFSDVSGLTDKPHRFLVNGTSEGSTVRCSERVRLLSDIGE